MPGSTSLVHHVQHKEAGLSSPQAIWVLKTIPATYELCGPGQLTLHLCASASLVGTTLIPTLIYNMCKCYVWH